MRAGRGRKGELLRRRGSLGLDLQILYREAQLVAALGTIAAVALYSLDRGLQLNTSVEKLSTVGTSYPLRTQ